MAPKKGAKQGKQAGSKKTIADFIPPDSRPSAEQVAQARKDLDAADKKKNSKEGCFSAFCKKNGIEQTSFKDDREGRLNEICTYMAYMEKKKASARRR